MCKPLAIVGKEAEDIKKIRNDFWEAHPELRRSQEWDNIQAAFKMWKSEQNKNGNICNFYARNVQLFGIGC